MRLVIFDVDGTIINSQAVIVAAMNEVFSEFGLPEPSLNSVLSIIGLTLEQAIARLLDRAIDSEICQMAVSYKNHFVELQKLPQMQSPLYEGITQVIDTLANQRETLLAIATGKSRHGLNKMIDIHDFGDKFIALRSADDCPSKPHPAMILECCEAAGCDALQSVMIGDSTYDMQMAIEAGCKALGVSWGFQPVHELVKSGAQAIVERPSDLPMAIDNIFASAIQ